MTTSNPSPSPSVVICKRCPIAGCPDKYSVALADYDEHMFEHYNYCKYGHYEEFEVGDPRWPECMAEKPHLWDRGPM